MKRLIILFAGFGESMADLVGFEVKDAWHPWAIRGFATGAVLLLGVINVAGVKWVIKLQFFLLLALLCAGLNFMVGSFVNEYSGMCVCSCKIQIYYLYLFLMMINNI